MIITHYITKDNLKIPSNHKYSSELKQRWSCHEPKTNSKILKLLDNINFSDNKFILDTGSHVGDTLFMISLYLIRNKQQNMKVIGVEPDAEKVSFIKQIINLNNINNIEIHCNAISDENKNYIINRSNTNSGAWTMEISDSGNAFVSLDEVCRNKEIYLMHLDIEGYEINAINSGKETIKTTSHLILEYEHIGLDKIKNILSLDKFEYEVLDAGDVYLKNLG